MVTCECNTLLLIIAVVQIGRVVGQNGSPNAAQPAVPARDYVPEKFNGTNKAPHEYATQEQIPTTTTQDPVDRSDMISDDNYRLYYHRILSDWGHLRRVRGVRSEGDMLMTLEQFRQYAPDVRDVITVTKTAKPPPTTTGATCVRPESVRSIELVAGGAVVSVDEYEANREQILKTRGNKGRLGTSGGSKATTSFTVVAITVLCVLKCVL